MSRFLYNILLALAWVAITGRYSFGNLLVGFVFGFLVIALVRDSAEGNEYVRRLPRVAGLAAVFLWEIVQANFRVAFETITPGRSMRPAIVAVPLDADGDFEVLLLSTLLTLTPDSLTVAVSPDRRVMYVHSMYVPDVDAFRDRIKRSFERRIMEVTR